MSRPPRPFAEQEAGPTEAAEVPRAFVLMTRGPDHPGRFELHQDPLTLVDNLNCYRISFGLIGFFSFEYFGVGIVFSL